MPVDFPMVGRWALPFPYASLASIDAAKCAVGDGAQAGVNPTVSAYGPAVNLEKIITDV
jgi:hypothetical protein